MNWRGGESVSCVWEQPSPGALVTFKTAATAIVLSLLTYSAVRAEPIGSAVRVVNQVSAEADQAKRALATGDGVSQNEVIAVEANSLGELRLNDETKLAIGPGSKLKLDKFVYDPNKASGAIAVDITVGAFRFITGVAKKNSYTIRTPSASISVRGTIFDVYVEPNGTMWVLLHEGSIEICNAARQCRVVNNPCSIVRVGASGDLTEAAPWNRQPRVTEITFETAFPFVVRPPQIDPSPRFTRVNVETGTCMADPIPPQPRVREASIPPSQPSTPYEPGPSSPPMSAPPQPVLSRWSGFYVGFNLGYGFSNQDTPTVCDDPFGIVDTTAANCALSFASGGLERSYSLSPDGFIGGLQGGYNFKIGNIVTGLEIDIERSAIEGTDSATANLFNGSLGQRRLTQDLDWLGTIRGRLGFLTNDLLIYATAGLAYGQSRLTYVGDYLAADDAIAIDRERVWNFGWTVGAGAEWGLGSAWSLKGEYLYFDLGEEDLNAQLVFSGNPYAVVFRPEFDLSGHIFRIGLNYRLGTP